MLTTSALSLSPVIMSIFILNLFIRNYLFGNAVKCWKRLLVFFVTKTAIDDALPLEPARCNVVAKSNLLVPHITCSLCWSDTSSIVQTTTMQQMPLSWCHSARGRHLSIGPYEHCRKTLPCSLNWADQISQICRAVIFALQVCFRLLQFKTTAMQGVIGPKMKIMLFFARCKICQLSLDPNMSCMDSFVKGPHSKKESAPTKILGFLTTPL